jgi:hypothetical protein
MATAASAVPGGSVDLALEGCTAIATGAVIPLDGGQVIPHA